MLSVVSLKIDVKIDKCELPTFYWLPKLHKRPYKSRFISNSSHCTPTILSKHSTSALKAIEDHDIKYSETAFSNSNFNCFGPLKLFRGHPKVEGFSSTSIFFRLFYFIYLIVI